MSRCPTCGHDPDDLQQARAGRERWAHVTPAERSARMKQVRAVRTENERKAREEAEAQSEGHDSGQ